MYYSVIENCRKTNNVLSHEIKREESLEEAVSNRETHTEELYIRWMRFERNEIYKILYNTSMEESARFKVLNLFNKQER